MSKDIIRGPDDLEGLNLHGYPRESLKTVLAWASRYASTIHNAQTKGETPSLTRSRERIFAQLDGALTTLPEPLRKELVKRGIVMTPEEVRDNPELVKKMDRMATDHLNKKNEGEVTFTRAIRD